MNQITQRLLILVAVVSLVIIAGSLFRLETRASASGNPLQGISAAKNAPTARLDATARIELDNARTGSGRSLAGQIMNEARVLPNRVRGSATYVIPSSTGDLCFFVERLVDGCTSPFSATNPVFFGVADPDGPGGLGPTVFGLAADGVQSVSFTVDGTVHTVTVLQNVFQFTGNSSENTLDFTNVMANFADGHSQAVA